MNRNVRNFCIIAHVDHGKSTLADRFLEITGTLNKREMKEQVLDAMDLEREKGITIKSHPVTMDYLAADGQSYRMNLIDTPGHVDFSYEVSRSLAACEGAVLVVDAAQGIQAQTLSNYLLARDGGLKLVPVLNKVDLPGAYPDQVADEVANLLGIEAESIVRISAKTGLNVAAVLERVVESLPLSRRRRDGHHARADLRLHLRPVPGRGRLRARRRRRHQAGRQDPPDGRREDVRSARCRHLQAGVGGAAAAQGGGRGLHRGQHQGRGRRAGGRHGHRRRPAHDAAAARLPPHEADGLLRHLPRGHGGLREPEGGARRSSS